MCLPYSFEAEDVLGHERKRWRADARRRETANRIDVVVRRQLARALHGEIERSALVVRVGSCEVVIQILAVRTFRERRMRREADALADVDVVDDERDAIGGCIVGQAVAR